MNIGIDIRAFKNGQTGIARYLRNLMDNLQVFDGSNRYFLFEPINLNYQISNKKWETICIPSKLPGILWQQFILPFYFKKYSIDIFWAPEQIAPIFFSGKTKIVTTVHDLVVYRFPQSCQKSNLYIQKLLFPQSLRKSATILPVSEYIKNELLSKFQFLKTKDITVVTNAGPQWTIPNDYSPLNRKNYLLCVGNIEPRKNIIRLIKAFEKIEDSDLKLVIVGPKGWKNTEFYQVIGASPKKSKIVIQGFVTEEELKTHYLSCKALIYPSVYEGFGIPVLEAFAMDCPVLTSKGTVMEEIAGDSANYFDPYNIDEIAISIKALCKREYKFEGSFKKRENIFYNKYNWSKSAQQIIKVWDDII